MNVKDIKAIREFLPPDAVQRTMRTSFIVSGESTSSKVALRSRYAHIQVSAAKRKQHLGDKEREHLEWMEASKEAFFILGRFLHEHRAEFVGLVQEHLEEWLSSPQSQSLNEREKMVHGIDWASWQAFAGLIESKVSGLKSKVSEKNIAEFLEFAIEHARQSAEDVTSETNINVFLQDFLTTFKSEDGIPHTCFHLEVTHWDHPPDWPNQNRQVDEDGQIRAGWKSYKLFIDPDQTLSAINIYLKKEGRQLTLRRKDLQAQLSKTCYWIAGNPFKTFGPKGARAGVRCWGFDLDKMEMGRQERSDAVWEQFIANPNGESDPRKGPFYAIVAALEAAQRDYERAAR